VAGYLQVVEDLLPPLRDLTLPLPLRVLAVDVVVTMVLRVALLILPAPVLVAVLDKVLDVLLLRVPVMWQYVLRLLPLGPLLLLLHRPPRLRLLLQLL